MKCTENFALILDRWFNNELSKRDSQNNSIRLAEDKEIKVAIIDDGVDVDRDDMIKSVEAGETFFDNQGQWPGHYTSSQGHGHLMACLIRQLCPRVKLYIAKLNEVWIDGKAQITAESAASVRLALNPPSPLLYPGILSLLTKHCAGNQMGARNECGHHIYELDYRKRGGAGQGTAEERSE